MRRGWLPLTVMLILLAGLTTTFARAPVELKQVAPLGEILLEVEARIAELEGLLVSAEKYEELMDTEVTEAFGVLACMGQAIAEHGDNGQTKIFGPALRDAALKFAYDSSYDDAKAALTAVKEAQAGGGNKAAPVEYPWEELFPMYPLMDEIEDRGGIISRIARRPRGGEHEPVHASTFAILSLVMHADTSYIDEADIPEWQAMSLQSQQLYTQLATAIREKDRRQSGDLFKKVAVSCTKCHEKFRD